MKTKLLLKSPQILAALFLTLFVSTEAAAAPVAYPDRLNTSVGVPKTVGVLWNDKGRGLYVSKVNRYSARGGRMYTVAGGRKIHYTPKAGFRGTDSFWYEIRDARGRTNSAKVTVHVRGGHNRARAKHHYNPGHHRPAYRPAHKPNYNVQWSQPGFSISYSKPGGVHAQFGVPSHRYVQPRAGGQHWGNRGRGGAPIARPDAYTTYASSGQVPLWVLANDRGHGKKVFKTNRWSKHGGQAWVVNNHTGSYIMYTPKPGFVGVDTVWYVMRDASGRKNSSRADITVW